MPIGKARFTNAVLTELRNYPRESRYRYRARPGVKLRGGTRHKVSKEFAKKLFRAAKYRVLAKNFLQRKRVVAALCPALQSLSNDAFEIAKVITPTLMTLRATGVIDIPLSPLYFASIALVIARIGINSICRRKKNTRARPKLSNSRI